MEGLMRRLAAGRGEQPDWATPRPAAAAAEEEAKRQRQVGPRQRKMFSQLRQISGWNVSSGVEVYFFIGCFSLLQVLCVHIQTGTTYTGNNMYIQIVHTILLKQ